MSSQKPNGEQDGQDLTPASTSGEGRTLSLLQKIRTGAVDAKCIRPAERHQLVAFLMADGCSAAEMAEILKVSDRTIERDKKAIREANAIARDPRLVEQMAGQLFSEAGLSVQQIRKAVRDKRISAAVKVDANQRCYQIVSDLVHRFQELGHLPTAARKLEADLTHHMGQVPDFTEMEAEVERITRVVQQESRDDPQAVEQLVQLQQEIRRASLSVRLNKLSSDLGKEERDNGTSDSPGTEGDENGSSE